MDSITIGSRVASYSRVAFYWQPPEPIKDTKHSWVSDTPQKADAAKADR